MANSADLERRSGELIQDGVVSSVDYDAATCTVELGDLVTGDLPWFAPRAGGVTVWSPPVPGEQCSVLCPEGDIDNGRVLLGLWSDANPPPSTDPSLVLIAFPDGARLGYHHADHALAASLPAGGSAVVDAPAGLTINADVTIKGNVSIEGKAEASEDVVGGGISLKSHKHSAVAAGTAQSGAPVP
ncbi:phage baseplate assembly protein V [uncultured Novosphingobium sp.]|uniref:phage baseplate assembly protein V n=1 Tax=uncultured Novosphingobium sp. TaxID=292277 RepID=UPI0025918DCB|nr:phage baseplate assembly protein V [uncultured Novosphingobium sp.]